MITPQQFAQKLVDWVATVTQLDPEKDALPNIDDWRRCAEKLFAYETTRDALRAATPPPLTEARIAKMAREFCDEWGTPLCLRRESVLAFARQVAAATQSANAAVMAGAVKRCDERVANSEHRAASWMNLNLAIVQALGLNPDLTEAEIVAIAANTADAASRCGAAEARVRVLEERIAAMQLMIDGQQGLLAAYRLGTRPSEATFAKLERARRALAKEPTK